MKTLKSLLVLPILLGAVSAAAHSAEVSASLSGRESYVGNPILLRIEVTNATAHEPPEIPPIDGVQVRSAGTPSRSSHVSIINGHRTERTSVSYAWRLSARREGSFEIPPIDVKVDGRTLQTKPLRFSATKSETGDLLFAEIEGREEHIFVGQPMDLKLRIWLRPYSNSRLNLTLSEGDMWQLISLDRSNWGIFADRLNEMAANEERPAGREVLRTDSEGTERRYYLYEIAATVYPKRPGQIDGDEIQIVVEYPTKLGKSRDPFDSFFNDDSFFGGRFPSMFRDEMPSLFGPQLRVTESRPIVASAEVNATDVRPIPTTNRPADYRGAVGRYKMVVQASPTDVQAGDPITLHLGIQGDGPMDLVQAPPLAEISELVRDFKVAEDPLAGIVKDDVKMFTASIRPRREGIQEIPPLPFSYFDPINEEYVTVKSEPISITVAAADQLALDSIVGRDKVSANTNGGEHTDFPPLNLDNYSGESVLKSRNHAAVMRPLLMGFIVPPLVFLTAMAVRYRRLFSRTTPRNANDAKPTIALIRQASSASEIVQGLLRFVALRLDRDESSVTTNTAQRLLRTKVTESNLAELTDVLQRCEQASYAGLSSVDLTTLRDDATECVARLSQELPRLPQTRTQRKKLHPPLRDVAAPARQSATISTALVLTAAFFFGDNQVSAIELTSIQRSTILSEATTAYRRARNLSDADAADSKQSFALAARKYQTLADSGVVSEKLYFNLGNAYLQSGQLGRAIASYEQAIEFNPSSPARANLHHARALLPSAAQPPTFDEKPFASVANRLFEWNATLPFSVKIGFNVAIWVVFWMLATLSLVKAHSAWRRRLIPIGVLTVIAGIPLGIDFFYQSPERAVVVLPTATLRAGNGEAFEELGTLSEGQTVKVQGTRDDWLKIASPYEDGWLKADEVILIAPSHDS